LPPSCMLQLTNVPPVITIVLANVMSFTTVTTRSLHLVCVCVDKASFLEAVLIQPWALGWATYLCKWQRCTRKCRISCHL
jgi:hypothetical protein